MKKTWLATILAATAACGPSGSGAPPPTTLPPATSTPATTAPAATPCSPVPASCDTTQAEKPDTDAEFGAGCVVVRPKRDDCAPVKERQKFKWKFHNGCGSKLYDVKIVDAEGRDLKECSSIPVLDKKGEIVCTVVERAECTAARGLKYSITWATSSGGTPQVQDPILEIRKYP